MFKKFFSVITVVMLSLCVLCSALTVSAAPGGINTGDVTGGNSSGEVVGKDENVDSEDEDEGEADTDPTQTTVTTEKETETVGTTVAETEDDEPVYVAPVEDEQEEETETEAETEVAETTEDGLLEGEFYVYLELNNGEDRRKRKLSEPGVVGKPNDPVRNGFIFEGWYADPEFKTEWNFATDIADEGTVIYAKWSADPSTRVYSITVKNVSGGYIQANPDSAGAGETIVIRAFPDDGKRLAAGSLTVNGKKIDILSFVMPADDVVISASFENVPETDDDEGISLVPFLVAGAVIAAGVVAAFVIVAKRRSAIIPVEFDENGAVIIDDDDDDDDWIDDSIIIEDGFKDGKIVKENVDPDFGEPDIDFED